MHTRTWSPCRTSPKLMEAYGHVGMTVTRREDLESTLEKAFAMKEELVFVDILVDPNEHVYPMQVARGSMKDMWLKQDGEGLIPCGESFRF